MPKPFGRPDPYWTNDMTNYFYTDPDDDYDDDDWDYGYDL